MTPFLSLWISCALFDIAVSICMFGWNKVSFGFSLFSISISFMLLWLILSVDTLKIQIQHLRNSR